MKRLQNCFFHKLKSINFIHSNQSDPAENLKMIRFPFYPISEL
ncbi:hypothetical protein HOLDEFILI_00657 [Holdemania filiformis DSM 12042]|uniref:Uncharacterized protein n=1 Tax=Holdemania filiformis DSM 12042 TaxID=545696 RepID=B9Y4C6_9FIRM|nr:hypothetical protein HOLDEFILI_00657 [Holdemania filiformis DSM 12042]